MKKNQDVISLQAIGKIFAGRTIPFVQNCLDFVSFRYRSNFIFAIYLSLYLQEMETSCLRYKRNFYNKMKSKTQRAHLRVENATILMIWSFSTLLHKKKIFRKTEYFLLVKLFG